MPAAAPMPAAALMAAKLALREAARLRGVRAVLWMVLTGGGRADTRSSSPQLSSSSQLSSAGVVGQQSISKVGTYATFHSN